jgi:hypothetical protein
LRPAWAALGPHAHPRRHADRPPGPVHTGGRRHDHHVEWSPHPSRGRQPRGRCGNLALRPPPVPTAQPPETGARHAGLACPGGQRQAGPLPAPDPARVRHRQPADMRDLGGVARVRAGSAVDPSRWTTRQPTGTWARSVVRVAVPHRPVPQTPPPDRGADGRVRTDGGGHRTAGHRTAGHQTAGRQIPKARSRTTNPGGRTPDGPDSQAPDDGDRGPGWPPGLVEHGDGADRWMPAGRSAGQMRLGDQPTRTAQQQGLRRGSRSYGRGLTPPRQATARPLRRTGRASAHCCPET